MRLTLPSPTRRLVIAALLLEGCTGSPAAAPPTGSAVAASTVETRNAAEKPRPSPDAAASPRPLPTAHVVRLLELAEVWGSVRFEHPYLFEQRGGFDVDWDGALARALPKLNAAHDEDEEAAAVQSMLAELHDPLTEVVTAQTKSASTVVPRPPTVASQSGVTVLTLGTITSPRQSDEFVERQGKVLSAAKRLVVDLRGPQDQTTAIGTSATLERLAPYLVRYESIPPVVRSVQHEGFVPQTLLSAREFSTYFAEQQSPAFGVGPLPHPESVVFLVDEHLGVLPLAAAMQRRGDALVIADGRATDSASRLSRTIPWGANHTVTVRRAEALALPPDEVVTDRTKARDRAIDVALRGRRGRASKPAAFPNLRPVHDAPYADEALPTLEHRVLAAFRFWNEIRYFYPYPEAENDPDTWDDALADTLPLFEAASTPLAYEQAIALLAARVHDSHTWVEAPHLSEWFGTGWISARLKDIDGDAVVTRVGEAAARGGLAVGDVILELGGEEFGARTERRGRFVAASNPWTLKRDSFYRAMLCAPGTSVDLRVRGASDVIRRLSLPCTKSDKLKPPALHWRRLDADVGYINLGRLEPDEVDAAFAALGDARGLVLDMRGYPRGTAIPIAARLNVHTTPAMADRVSVPLVAPHDEGADARIVVGSSVVPAPSGTHYAGKTVMLVDEETQSAAEETGLFFEAANGTTFVGSPSAGANGDITYAVLPGNIIVHFAGSAITHADGRPLQRVGLRPSVQVQPTLAGIRAGKDEVLDRAVQYLRSGR